jgi:hypothetical protein
VSEVYDSSAVAADGGERLKNALPFVTNDFIRELRESTNGVDKKLPFQWPVSTRILLVEDNLINRVVALG